MALHIGISSGKLKLTPNDKIKNVVHLTGLWDKFNNVDKILQSIDEDEGAVWVLTKKDTVTLHVELGNTIHEISTSKTGYESLLNNLLDETLQIRASNQDLLDSISRNLGDFIDQMYVYAVQNSTEELPDDVADLAVSVPTSPVSKGKDVKKPTPTSNIQGIPSVQAPNYISPALEEDPAIGAKELADATRLYTPVWGTSKGSRYHLVIRTSTGVKVAARYINNTLSLRALITPHKVTSHDKHALDELGFTGTGVDLISAHYAPCTEEQAQRTLGALLGSFKPSTILTALPVVSVFCSFGA